LLVDLSSSKILFESCRGELTITLCSL
jgi:hypothetical protein